MLLFTNIYESGWGGGSSLFAEVPVQVFPVQKGSANDVCRLLITFAKGWTQIRPDILSYLIWIQLAGHSDGTFVFPK